MWRTRPWMRPSTADPSFRRPIVKDWTRFGAIRPERDWQLQQSDALIELARAAGETSLVAELKTRAALERGGAAAEFTAFGSASANVADPQLQLAVAEERRSVLR